jgi:hypothetical protein
MGVGSRFRRAGAVPVERTGEWVHIGNPTKSIGNLRHGGLRRESMHLPESVRRRLRGCEETQSDLYGPVDGVLDGQTDAAG